MTVKPTSRHIREHLPPEVVRHLGPIARQRGAAFLTGGTVRDLLLGRASADVDLSVEGDARAWARDFAAASGGTYVRLGRQEDAARVAWPGLSVDFSSYREGSVDIVGDLAKRDLTINAMAIRIDSLLRDARPDAGEVDCIDPLGGRTDLAAGIVRFCAAEAVESDPLRMLRVYRFSAVLGFRVDPASQDLVRRHRALIGRIAAERLNHELELIMASPRAGAAMELMAASGLLFHIIPELRAGVDMAQPASHHLDVFGHSLAALRAMEEILAEPERFFGPDAAALADAHGAPRQASHLKWAALLHDLGKPVCHAVRDDLDGRITFYNHDQEGARLLQGIALRLLWSREDRDAIALLIREHMRLFHLHNARRRGQVGIKAYLRLIRDLGEGLAGLFLLSMADSLAGKGEGAPEDMEAALAELWREIDEVRRQHVQPVRSGPPLLSGRDLIEGFGLEPSPLFRRILDGLEEARMEKTVNSREEAEAWVREFLSHTIQPVSS